MRRMHLFLISCLLFFEMANAQTPNVILIVVDDLGYNDLGVYGTHEALTPNIDRIGSQGIRFTNLYVNPVCSPSRFSFLTGLYVNRSKDRLYNAIASNAVDKGLRSADGPTLADHFREAGYRTRLIGKWHLGHGDILCCGGTDNEFHPLNHGFESFYGFLAGNIDYNTHWYETYWPDWFRDREPSVEQGYSTDLLTKETVTYIQQQAQSSHPFFVYLAYNAVHYSYKMDAAPELRLQLPAGREREYLSRFDHLYASDSNIRKRYLAVLAVLDDGIGEILAELDKQGITKNTLVILMSDNGGDPQYGARNSPLKSGKGTLWEGGIRVPALMQLPGVIPAGTTSAQSMHAVDLVPTVLGLAGLAHGASDGVDLSAQVRGAPAVPRDIFHSDPRRGKAYRRGRWKYHSAANGTEYLFDLEADVGETTNLSNVHPQILAELRALHAGQEDRLKEPPKPTTLTQTSVADAFVRGGTYANKNYGSAEALYVRKAGAEIATREAYVKFDLSSISGAVTRARVRLFPFDAGMEGQIQYADVVPDDSWDERTITWSNRPEAGTPLGNWTVTVDYPVEIDVTTAVREAQSTDKVLSLRIYRPDNGKSTAWVRYGTREHPTYAWRPQLLIDFESYSPAAQTEDAAIASLTSHGAQPIEPVSESHRQDINTVVLNEFSIDQNYPNPFNSTTTIRFYIPQTNHVAIEVFDVVGRRVDVLLNGMLQSGMHEATWDARASSGAHVPGGVYFYRLTAGSYVKTMAMTLSK